MHKWFFNALIYGSGAALGAVLLMGCSEQPVTSESHLGVYSSTYPGLPHVKFYRSEGKNYLITPWGHQQIQIKPDGTFDAVAGSEDATGTLSSLEEGVYQKVVINYWGESHQLTRVEDAEGEALIELLYGSNWFNPISPVDDCDDDWLVKKEEVTFDHTKLDALLEKLNGEQDPYQKTSSLLVMKQGQLIVEEYMNGWQAEYPHSIQSISKSLTSLMVGVAIEEGLIEDEESPLSTYLPHYTGFFQGDKSQLTLKHFLTMSSGLDWDEWSLPYSDPNNVRYQEMFNSEPVKFVLDRELVQSPGAHFTYNGGLVTVVGEILADRDRKANLAGYIPQSKMAELCFKNAYMSGQMGNVSNAAGGGFLRARDMLKLGMLVLNDGQWKGKQIVSKDWIERSTQFYVATNWDGSGYGYYWWINDHFVDGKTYRVVYGLGYGGQVIAVVKELDLIVVKTATNYAGQTNDFSIMKHDILPIFVGYED
ncbi:serine hydrolase domain-containing protein [Vibrio sp. TRT 21S02]|uniref:serine hydrolase domain-containing protein n=1 Tax=Vibrio sp. TRT 21S02 TaxID=3418507 RepID=UPI003CEFFA36